MGTLEGKSTRWMVCVCCALPQLYAACALAQSDCLMRNDKQCAAPASVASTYMVGYMLSGKSVVRPRFGSGKSVVRPTPDPCMRHCEVLHVLAEFDSLGQAMKDVTKLHVAGSRGEHLAVRIVVVLPWL